MEELILMQEKGVTVYATKTKYISNLNSIDSNQNNSTNSNNTRQGSSNVSGSGSNTSSSSSAKKGTNIPINKKN